MNRLWGFVGIAVAVAVGIALAPYVWSILGIGLGLLPFVGLLVLIGFVWRVFVRWARPRWEAWMDTLTDAPYPKWPPE